jgi:hypothetical protein
LNVRADRVEAELGEAEMLLERLVVARPSSPLCLYDNGHSDVTEADLLAPHEREDPPA